MAPISRSLAASEIVVLAKRVDCAVRVVDGIRSVIVCVHVIIHGVMHLSLTIGDARCTADVHSEITVTAGPASALMAVLVKVLVLDPMLAIAKDPHSDASGACIINVADSVIRCLE